MKAVLATSCMELPSGGFQAPILALSTLFGEFRDIELDARHPKQCVAEPEFESLEPELGCPEPD